MGKWKCRFAVLFVLISLLPVHLARGQDSFSDAPYLYYYSDDLMAFVIERADGTDSRVFGDGLMKLTGEAWLQPFAPEGRHSLHIEGPGWSPSGQWFAWTAAERQNLGGPWIRSWYQMYLINVDGTRLPTPLDDHREVWLAWAPNDDVLLMVSHYVELLTLPTEATPQPPGYIHTEALLFEPMSQQVMASGRHSRFFERLPDDPDLYKPALAWTSDGQQAIVSYSEAVGSNWEETQAVFHILGRGGDSHERILSFRPLNQSTIFYGDNYPRSPSISPLGAIIYPSEDGLVIENLLTGDKVIVRHIARIKAVKWHPTGLYALLRGEKVWLLKIDHGATVRELPISPYALGRPDREQPLWSPDGQHLLSADLWEGRLYHLDLRTQLLTSMPIEVPAMDDNITWTWTNEARALVKPTAYDDDEHPIADVYDFAAGTHERIVLNKPTSDWVAAASASLSNNEQYIAFIDEGPVIYEVETGISHFFQPGTNEFYTMLGGEVFWHHSGDWLITHDDALIGGGGYYRNLGVMRRDGTIQRSLSSVSWPTPVVIGWLPPQVNPGLLPPVSPMSFPEPDMTLNGSNWSLYLSWSPDSQQLASSMVEWGQLGETLWDIWNLKTGSLTQTVEVSNSHDRAHWIAAPNGEYSPTFETIDVEAPLAVSHDGRLAVVTRQTGYHLAVVERSTGSIIQILDDSSDFYAASFSPDDRLLIVSSPFYPFSTRIWDTQTWDVLLTFPEARPGVAFSPDGTKIAVSRSWDIDIYDVATLLDYAAKHPD
jgi:hypothetical protein